MLNLKAQTAKDASMVLINKVFIGQTEKRVGQEMPVVVTNGGKNQLILIQKNYLSKWKILGRV